MIQQPSINQEFQTNKLYLNHAVIKGAMGKNITIEWGQLDKEDITPNRTLFSRENIEEVSNSNIDYKESQESTDKQVENDEVKLNKEEINSKEANSKEQNVKETDAANDGSQKGIIQKNINTYYGIATNEAFNIQLGVGGKTDKNGKWVNASASEIKKYFVPSEANINKYKYQFLNLASLAGISESEAKKYLENKGILSGKEATFIEAAKANNINEIYLMAHACLETGNGKSKLATGVNYKGTVVYNMFGIHAYDSDPIGQGSAYAYKMGWTTPEKAILGGAKFISTNYINNFPYNQDTLYEMRWNPANPGDHQYATDIAWAINQAAWIEKIYSTFESATVTFDIPIYRK